MEPHGVLKMVVARSMTTNMEPLTGLQQHAAGNDWGSTLASDYCLLATSLRKNAYTGIPETIRPKLAAIPAAGYASSVPYAM